MEHLQTGDATIPQLKIKKTAYLTLHTDRKFELPANFPIASTQSKFIVL